MNAAGSVSTVAGQYLNHWGGDGGPAAGAELFQPYGVAVDTRGDVYIAETGNHRIRNVDASTGIITTVAGNGSAGFSGDNGPGPAAQLNYPMGLVVDGGGNLFIADAENSVANAAIVPAGTDGAINVYVTDRTHVIIDINGYFAP